MSQDADTRAISKTSLSVCIALFVFAILLLLGPLPFYTPVDDVAPLAAWAVDTTPVRQPKLSPEYAAAGFTFKCNECHDIIPAPAANNVRAETQHREIVLEHGINTWCLSCHHPENRNAFVDDRGGEISWDQPQLLCSKCHGPVYRDWQHGAHGRTNGYWDTTQGAQDRRKCIECHDPHRPPFPKMQPAPGPNTLRMGPQDHDDHGPSDNPLRVAAAAQSDPHHAQTEEAH